MATASREILDRLEAAGHRAVLLGDIIPPGRHLVDCSSVPDYLLDDDTVRERCTADEERTAADLAYNVQVAEQLQAFVSPNEVQCPDGVCVFFPDGRLMFRDDSHLNIWGSEWLVDRLRSRLPF